MKTKLKTFHKQGAKAIIRKTVFNLFPSYRRSGGRVCFISDNLERSSYQIALQLENKKLRWFCFWWKHLRRARPNLHGSIDLYSW